MKISVITVVHNGEKTIRDCIDSVLMQAHNDIEYIIVDGSSADRTREIIESYGDKINVFISEPDGGIYDAMNKGVKLATGEVVAILNADDFYINQTIFEHVANAFTSNNADIVFGDILYVDKDNKNTVKRIWRTGEFKRWKLWLGWIMPHPAVFVRKNVYNKKGFFDLNFSISSDYDFLVRLLKDSSVKFFHLKEALVKMRIGGKSDVSLKRHMEGIYEDCRVFQKNYGIFPFWFFVTRPLIKLNQFFLT